VASGLDSAVNPGLAHPVVAIFSHRRPFRTAVDRHYTAPAKCQWFRGRLAPTYGQTHSVISVLRVYFIGTGLEVFSISSRKANMATER